MDAAGAEELGRRQAEVRGDFERLAAEASMLPEAWTGIRWDGPDVVVLLTEPARHAEQLIGLAEHPDRIRFERAGYSRRRLDEVHREVVALLDAAPQGAWDSHGPGLDAVVVGLRSTQADLAQRLHDRFGDALDITLGGHRFPLGAGGVQPRPAPTSTIDLPGVTASAEPERTTYRAGDEIHGSVRVRNAGADRVDLDTGEPAIGVLLGPDRRVVGGFSGWIAGVGRTLVLEPGGEATIRFIAGSDSVDPGRGATVEPGGYLLVIRLDLTGRGRSGVLVTDPVPIELRPTPPRLAGP